MRERDLPFVTHTLSSEFTILRVVNGETVAAENLSITNGFVKPKMGELGLGERSPAEGPTPRIHLVLPGFQLELSPMAGDGSQPSPAHSASGWLHAVETMELKLRAQARWWPVGKDILSSQSTVHRGPGS